MWRARLGLALGLLALGTPAVAGSPAPGPDGRTLVIAAVAAPKHVSFVGQISTIRSGTVNALAIVETIQHRAPDQTRRTFLAPQSLYGQYVISRGADSWDVDESRKRVTVTENKAAVDPVEVVDDVALVDTNYHALRTAADNVADRRTDVVDLVSKYTGERAMRLWIDSETHVVLAKEAYHSDGSLAWRTRFDAIRYTDAIPAELFTQSVPADFVHVRGRSYEQPTDFAQAAAVAGFKPITPKYLPEGFSLFGANVSTIRGTRSLHLIYSDGIRPVSLFENPTNRAIDFGTMKAHTTSFEGHPASYVRDGPTMLLTWREHGLAFALVGDLELRDMVNIATSVVP
ncbi:MAG TPA: sigma-E factor regulatory protein RseB domain-containing protein [Candidatus Limnocylindria bacterium]|nr:sigma-E factor regulatory protein RseB domain-containing protein [Candidatus Limnocylindria bacterium]